jgi:hypothetical protein
MEALETQMFPYIWLKHQSKFLYLYGDFKYSAINTIEDYNGFKSSLNFKTSGKYRYSFSEDIPQRDNNDLGINFYTNFYNLYSNLSTE